MSSVTVAPEQIICTFEFYSHITFVFKGVTSLSGL